MFLFAMLITLS